MKNLCGIFIPQAFLPKPHSTYLRKSIKTSIELCYLLELGN